MDTIYMFGIVIAIIGIVAWRWVRGIDKMMRDFPDYKGEDFLDETPPKKNEWKQDDHHTKQRI